MCALSIITIIFCIFFLIINKKSIRTDRKKRIQNWKKEMSEELNRYDKLYEEDMREIKRMSDLKEQKQKQ